MVIGATGLATFDDRPFFDKALRYGVEQGIISPERLQGIAADFAKGIVQIAHYFGTAHLRPELEMARHRMVNLIGLYLEDLSGGDLQIAANALRDRPFLSLSKGGSDMLRQLHAIPDSTLVAGNPVTSENQRAYLDERTAAKAIPLVEYRTERALRQEKQNLINFSFWLAKKMGAAVNEIDDADALIRSAMLVIFIDKAALRIPTRTTFVRLIKAARDAKARFDENRLEAFVKDAPAELQQLARCSMDRFIRHDLPQIRMPDNSADKLLHGASGQPYFINENLDEDVREYDRLVAREWDRVMRGKADDPAVLATVFLFLAAGLAPKASMLLKEAKAIIGIIRASGFDDRAVNRFIDEHAPEAERDDLRRFWSHDLRNEAAEQLADNDPDWPDVHMERALAYLRKTGCAAWKGRRR